MLLEKLEALWFTEQRIRGRVWACRSYVLGLLALGPGKSILNHSQQATLSYGERGYVPCAKTALNVLRAASESILSIEA